MRSLLLVAIVAVVGLVAWWSFGGDDGPVPTHGPSNPATPNDTPAPLAPSTGRIDTSPTQPAAPSPSANTPKPPPTKAPGDAAATVELRVRDLAARTTVPAFRWRFQNSLGTHKGEGKDGVAACALPPSSVGELLVEADGLQPCTKSLVVPTAPAPPLVVDVFLGPAAPATGITLHVRDTALQPIAWVRVDAFPITDDNRKLAWHLGNPMWARRTGAADGRYTLPPLTPGEYGIRIVATDENGEMLPLLPFRNVYALTGSNGFVEDVPLEPGALLALELVHGNEPLDPVRHGKTTLSLRLPGGPAVERRWVVRNENVEAGAIDVLAGPGRVHLADAIPAGQYQFEVFVGGQPRVQQMLFLRPGVRNEERVLVP
ncbi:MAG: hypothetical protein JNK15_16560 [Planctomycetes bacterium]|nr:hypothetical protein [Planctomycetota bacterium]